MCRLFASLAGSGIVLKVTVVHPDSLGAELGLRSGTEIISVGGREVEDFIDWGFLTAEDQFLLHVRHPDGEEIEYDVERPEDLPMGVEADPPLRQPVRLLLRGREPGRPPEGPVHPRR